MSIIFSEMLTKDLESLIADWEQFEKEGAAGDCLLRRTARNYMSLVGSRNNIVWWMRDIAFSAYRELYKRAKADAEKAQQAHSDASWALNRDRQGGI